MIVLFKWNIELRYISLFVLKQFRVFLVVVQVLLEVAFVVVEFEGGSYVLTVVVERYSVFFMSCFGSVVCVLKVVFIEVFLHFVMFLKGN